MGTPLVSVIIPAYNHEKFVGKAVESVLGQTMPDFELIVVDDGSTDKTGKIVQSYTDSRLSYYHQENQDAYNTINRGMNLARGKYLAILNSDDIYTLDRLERLLLHQRQNNNACLFTDVIPISDQGEEFTDPEFGWNIWHQGNRIFFNEVGDLYTGFLHGNFMVTTSNLFMTREAVQRVGSFCSLRYLHDYDFIFRMMLAHPGQVDYLQDDKLLYYRIHSGNTLGEAAILGREQDRDLIGRYMLQRIPEAHRADAKTGAQRLVALEKELAEVRAVLNQTQSPGIRCLTTQLGRALLTKLGPMIGKR